MSVSSVNPIETLTSEILFHKNKWENYERDYILPCFDWAKEEGIDLQKLVHENPGKNCVQLLVEELRKEIARLKNAIQKSQTR